LLKPWNVLNIEPFVEPIQQNYA